MMHSHDDLLEQKLEGELKKVDANGQAVFHQDRPHAMCRNK